MSEDAVISSCWPLSTSFSGHTSTYPYPLATLELTYDGGRTQLCWREPDATGRFAFTNGGQTTQGAFRISASGSVSWTSDQGATGTGWAYWVESGMVMRVAGLWLTSN